MDLGDTMRRRKRNRRKMLAILILLILCGGFAWMIINAYNAIQYRKTYEYKLLEHGYSENDTGFLKKHFDEHRLDYLLEKNADERIVLLLKDDYFIFDNLDRYLALWDDEKRELREIVAMVNANTDRDFYSDVESAFVDIDNRYLILVNKFYQLPEDFKPDEKEAISSMYAYANRVIDASIYDEFKSMWHAADQEDLTLIVQSAFRSFEAQKNIHNSFLASHGREATERFSARAGHSEHQLGFALDITTPGYGLTQAFEETDEFKWLKENAHKFGFILRYPKDAEHITGYLYEPWHYRYVGEEVAAYIYQNSITFDEYYAYYLK